MDEGPVPLACEARPQGREDGVFIVEEEEDDGEEQCMFTPVMVQAHIGQLSLRPLLDTRSGVLLIPGSTVRQIRSARSCMACSVSGRGKPSPVHDLS